MSTNNPAPQPGVSVNRRRVVALGGTGILAGLAGALVWKFPDRRGAAVFQVDTSSGSKPAAPTPIIQTPSAMSAERFSSLVNTEFRISGPAGETACKLVSVTPETRQVTEKGTFLFFSLIFESTAALPADGATCRLSHPSLEPLEVFLSPVGDGKDKIFLEAAFSTFA